MDKYPLFNVLYSRFGYLKGFWEYMNSMRSEHEFFQMHEINEQLKELFDRIPRRHTAENVKEMYSILDAYEDLLTTMEADARFEQQIARFFDALEPIRATVKKSNDPKASKKTKDVLFDEASGALKDEMDALMQLNKS